MVKQKSNNNNMVVGLVNGSMAVAKQSAKVKLITRSRHFMAKAAELTSSQMALSSTQAPFPVGCQFSAGTLLFSLSELTDSAISWVQSHDVYRLASIEVFVTLASRTKSGVVDKTIPVELYFYEDTDADPATQTSWIRTSDRDNLGRVVLNATHPSQRLITFKPTVSFAAGQIDQNPGNVVPGKNTWLDALTTTQLYSGLRFFSACPQIDSVISSATYEYSLAFNYRVKVEAKQPI